MTTRIQIRDAIKTRIEPHFAKAFAYGQPQLYEEDLPAACVYFESGESARDYDGDPDTTGAVVIHILTAMQDNIDAALDRLASLVNESLQSDPELGGLVDNLAQVGFVYDRDPDSFFGSLLLMFRVQFEDDG